MTIKEKLKGFLTSNGMSDSEADEVLNLATPRLEGSSTRVNWQETADAYPDEMYAAWCLTLFDVALKWIDENCPLAWFRPMFTPDPEAEIARLEQEMAATA